MKDMSRQQGSPIIYVVYSEQDRNTKDAIVRHFLEILPKRAPGVHMEFRDYEQESWGCDPNSKFRAGAEEAWYALFIVSNHWAHLRRNLLTELFVLEDRADSLGMARELENEFVSILCIEEVDARVEALLARFHATCQRYTTPAEANQSIEVLIDKFRTRPAWKADKTTAP